MRPEPACSLQYLSIVINPYSVGGREMVLINSPVNFIGEYIVEIVPGLPATEMYYSNFTLIDFSGLAVSTSVTTFSK